MFIVKFIKRKHLIHTSKLIYMALLTMKQQLQALDAVSTCWVNTYSFESTFEAFYFNTISIHKLNSHGLMYRMYL